MGMKSNSGRFSRSSGAGGTKYKRLGMRYELNLQMFGKMPSEVSQIKHIMREEKGHLKDTPKNRKRLENISSDEKNYIRTDKYGNRIYAKVINNTQYWVYTRNGIIQNGGANKSGNHRDFSGKMKGGNKK